MLEIIAHCNIYQWLQKFKTKSEKNKNKRKTKTKEIKSSKQRKAAYKYEIHLKLDKLKNQEITKVKFDLTRIK